MHENRADSFLRLIRQARRGRLKIYLGYAAGVGKTFRMLQEAHRLRDDGVDVVVGIVETHGRPETEALLTGLETVPDRRVAYRGIELREMDLDAILARRPDVVLVDELAHTNVPGSKNAKRYEDVEEILAAGIHVVSTLNIQHLESLYETVERATGVKVKERIPDPVVAGADHLVNVDITVEDLRQRLQEGKVYTPERIEVALEHFFRATNLEQLRELTLREIAAQIDSRRRGAPRDEEVPANPDQVMVSLSSRGPNSDALLRYASRLAGRLNRNWYAVYVQTSSERPAVIDAATQRVLSNTLTLAQQLGATVFTYRGDDIVKTLLQFAKEYRVGHIVIGRPGRELPFWRRLLGDRSIPERLLAESSGITIVVLDPTATAVSRPATDAMQEARDPLPSAVAAHARSVVRSVTGVVWERTIEKTEAMHRLLDACRQAETLGNAAWAALRHEEARGSTFIGDDVAVVHARLEGVRRPEVVIGLGRQGIADVEGGREFRILILLVSSPDSPDEHVAALAEVGRIAANDRWRKAVMAARNGDEIERLAAERNDRT